MAVDDVETPVKQIAKPTPSGLVMEVVIPIRYHHSSVKSDRSSVPSSPQSEDPDSEQTNTRKRKRRAAAKAIVITSDDDEESQSEAASKQASSSKKAKSTTKSSKKRRVVKRDSSPSSDYRGSSSEEEDDDSDVEMSSLDDDDDESPKAKLSKSSKKAKVISKPKSAPKGRSKVKASEDTGNEDDMEVDEPVTKTGKKQASKRKAADDTERPAKKAKRTDSDPWKLGSRAVKSDWTLMQAPPFEMFHFARVVVDEYTYLDGKVHALVTNLTAERQWVLSGTPPIHDFGALKTISAFLNIHLGVDDDGEGQSAEIKKRLREQTGMHAVNFSNDIILTLSKQPLNASTLSAKFTVFNGMPIGILLVNLFLINSFDK